jgi:hypothetical protein
LWVIRRRVSCLKDLIWSWQKILFFSNGWNRKSFQFLLFSSLENCFETASSMEYCTIMTLNFRCLKQKRLASKINHHFLTFFYFWRLLHCDLKNMPNIKYTGSFHPWRAIRFSFEKKLSNKNGSEIG